MNLQTCQTLLTEVKFYNHPLYADSWVVIGQINQSEGNNSEALEHLKTALNIYSKSLNEDHPKIVSVKGEINELNRI